MVDALAVADLAAEQWGLVTTAQARELGVSAQAIARLADQGVLERQVHGVYRVMGAPPSRLDGLRAAWLGLEPTRTVRDRVRDDTPQVVSHRSAALVHGLGNLEADELEFTSVERKQTRRGDVRIHRGDLERSEWTLVEGLPVTTVTRTIEDLAAAHVDGGHLAGVVRDALTRQQVDDRAVAAVLRQYAHRYGAPLGDGDALLARLVQEAGIPESIERVAGLAAPSAMSPVQLIKMQEQVAAISRALAPAFEQINTQLATGAPMASSEALQRVQEQINSYWTASIDPAAASVLAEISRVVGSEVLLRAIAERPEVQEVSRRAGSAVEQYTAAFQATPSEPVAGEVGES